MSPKSIAVLGTVCCDEIIKPGKELQTGLGGIYYDVITLAQLLDDADTIYPVCKIGEQDYEFIIGEFKKYQSINFDYVQKYPGKNNTVRLVYYSDAERTEYSTNLPDKFTEEELEVLPDVDLFIVNFISGIEMGYDTFCSLKSALNCPLYVDLHSIFLGFRDKGERYYRVNENWRRWQVSGDIVQMNEIEAEILSGRKFDDKNTISEFGKFLLDKGANTVIITRGSKGVSVFWKKGEKKFEEQIGAYNVNAVEDPTGCGDVFSAAYAHKYLEGTAPAQAADFASKVAGIRAGQKNSTELHKLKALLNDA